MPEMDPLGKDLKRKVEEMGAFEGIVEGLIQGGTFGLSNLVGITGKGGLLHDGDDDPENQAVLVDEDGVYFIENKEQISWDDVIEIVEQQEGLWRFEFRGGLTFHTGWIVWEVYKYAGNCTSKNPFEIDYDGEEWLDDFIKALDDTLWAVNFSDKIRDLKHILVNEAALFLYIKFIYFVIYNHFTDEEDGDDWGDGHFGKIRECVKSQLCRLDIENSEELGDDIAEIFSLSYLYDSSGIDFQIKKYDCLRNAKAFGKEFEGNESIDVLTKNSKDNGHKPFGAEEWHNKRKVIVCSDKKADLSIWREGLKIPNVMVMDAQDIIDYNNNIEPKYQLKFDLNHPQNGVSYIQHPKLQNVYIDVNSFHTGILEQKYNELIRVLTALGATKISCIVENSESKEESGYNKCSVEGSFSYKTINGAGHFSSDLSSSKITNLYKRLSVERILTPSKTIELPNDLVFYPSEQRWQDLAKLAKEGRLKKEVVDLTYRTDYAVTGKYLRDISGKIEALIAGAEVAYSEEFEHELKELQSIVWHYEVEFGDMESATPCEISEQIPQPLLIGDTNSESDRAKQILSKRIKRYTQSNNGFINQEQRADLESFAQKYGIDELELEEMIEEAF